MIGPASNVMTFPKCKLQQNGLLKHMDVDGFLVYKSKAAFFGVWR